MDSPSGRLRRLIPEPGLRLARRLRRFVRARLATVARARTVLSGVGDLAARVGNQALMPGDDLARLAFLRTVQGTATAPEWPCLACGADAAGLGPRSRLAGRPVPPRFDRTVCFCQECGLFFISPMYSADDLDVLYGSGYQAGRPFAATEDPARFARENERFLATRAASLVNVEPRLGAGAGRRALDIGSYSGLMLLALGRLGYEVTGIEPSPEALAFSRRVVAAAGGRATVRDGLFEEVEVEGPFHLVYGAHVIEHVVDPLRFLRKAARSLADEGLIVLETPLFEQFGLDYATRFADEHHTLFFTVRGLASVATHAGLAVAGFHQVAYQLQPGRFTTSAIVAFAKPDGTSPLGARNQQLLFDLYEDSVRRQTVLVMREMERLVPFQG